MSNSCDPTDYSPPDFSVHGILQARILEWVAFPFSRGSSQPRDGTQVSHIAGRFFTSWATREAQEYWVGSLSLLQGIFPTQGWNPGLPHCRWIHYQMSHEGSPRILEWIACTFSRGSSWPRNWTGVSLQADSLPTELPGKPRPRVNSFLTMMPRQVNGERKNFFNKWYWDNWISMSRRMNLDLYFTSYTKNIQSILMIYYCVANDQKTQWLKTI